VKADGQPLSGLWIAYKNRSIDSIVDVDRRAGHGGKGASAHARGVTDYSGVARSVTLRYGERYRLSFWYRTSPDARHVYYGIVTTPPAEGHLPPATTWTRYERELTVRGAPSGQHPFWLILALRHGASPADEAWFDDVRLEWLSVDGVAKR
jgi:hypothetical protein